MYCPRCRAWLPDTATMCNNCGTVIQRSRGPAMTYNEPVSPLVQTLEQRNAEVVEQKKQQKKNFPVKPAIIGAGALVVIAILITLVVVLGKDRGTLTADNDTTESTFGSIGSDITEEQDTSSAYADHGDDYEVFNIGETWTVDGQWSLTVMGAKKTEERNTYSDKEPVAVYIIDYVYTNIGYEDDIMDGIFFSMSDDIVDSKDRKGYSYTVNLTNYPEQAPKGATCVAQACVGLEHDGTFTVYMTKYDKDSKPHKASFVIDPTKEAYNIELPPVDTAETKGLKIGETWTVDGQWSITITGVKETDKRNKYSSRNPEKVYVVEYTYTNLGYENDIMDGLYISLDDMIVDNAGMMGYQYSMELDSYPQPIQIGETITVQTGIGVQHAGDFSITLSMYDTHKNKQRETFRIKVQ